MKDRQYLDSNYLYSILLDTLGLIPWAICAGLLIGYAFFGCRWGKG